MGNAMIYKSPSKYILSITTWILNLAGLRQALLLICILSLHIPQNSAIHVGNSLTFAESVPKLLLLKFLAC